MAMNRFVAISTIVLLLCGGVSVTGCAGNAIVATNPSEDQVQQVRQVAVRIADGVATGLTIVQSAGRFIDTLPLSDEKKNEFDMAIVAVTGTSEAPGPLVAGLAALQTATAEPELKATVSAILVAVEPLLQKMLSSDDAGIAGFGLALQAALGFTRIYAGVSE